MTTTTPPAVTAPLKAQVAARIREFLSQDRRDLRLLLACVIAVLCTAVDPTYFSLTSDEVQAFLRETDSSAPLVIAVEYLAIAVMTLVLGTTGDLIGRRRLMLIGLVTILLANFLGALTLGTPAYLLMHRINIVAGACVLSMCVAIVALSFSNTLRPFAFGMIFGFRSVALLLSSSMTYFAVQLNVQALSFVPVVAMCVLAIVLVNRFVQESRADEDNPRSMAFVNLARLGAVFATAFVILTSRSLLNNMIVALLIIGILGITAYVVRWWTQRRQSFDHTAIFTGRDVALAIVAGMLISGIQGAFLFELWTFNSLVQSMHWFVNSLRLVPYVIGVLAGSFLVLQVTQRLGARRSLAGGMGLMAVGMLCMSLIRSDASYAWMLVPIFLIGFGFGLSTPVRAQVVLSAPPENLIGAAAAVNNATGLLGYAIGIAISSGLVMRVADSSMLGALQDAGVDPLTLDKVVAALPDYVTRATQATYEVLPQVLQSAGIDYAGAWMDGLSNMYLVFGIALLLGAAVVYFGKTRLSAVSGHAIEDKQ
jgi:MFS family permease